jgi:hypothetical protein
MGSQIIITKIFLSSALRKLSATIDKNNKLIEKFFVIK